MRRLGLGLNNETTFFALETITAFFEQGGFVMVDETNGTDGTKRFAKCSLPLNHEHRILVPFCAKDTALQYRDFSLSLRRTVGSFRLLHSHAFELAYQFAMMVIKTPFKRRWKIEVGSHVENPNDLLNGAGRHRRPCVRSNYS